MSNRAQFYRCGVGSVALLIALVAFGCGGGGATTYSSAGTLAISTVTFPPTLSGEYMDFEIPIAGGCGGPYDLNIVSGDLPDGLYTDATPATATDPARHHFVGFCMAEGKSNFRLQVVDKGCSPFQFAFADLQWTVGVGEVAIVDANPKLEAPVATDPLAYDDIDALPATVYGQFVAIDLLVAGGVPPYEVTVMDDHDDPLDGQLPLGVVLAPGSGSLVGTPTEILASGRPFRITFSAIDSMGNIGVRKLQWAVTTPPIEFIDPGVLQGKVGEPFSESIQIASGVPPFRFELVDDVPNESNLDFTYVQGQAPTFTSATGFTVGLDGIASNRLNANGGATGGSTAVYPPVGAIGTLTPMPPEGVYLKDDDPVPSSASLTGSPWREGTYLLHVHAYSTVVPNSPAQHVFGSLDLQIAAADPFVIDAIVTNEKPASGLFSTVEPYNSLPEFELGAAYNPDGGSPGLQLIANGGVPQDGYFAAPHSTQRVVDPAATPGAYGWGVDWDPLSTGATQLPGVDITSAGDVKVDNPALLQRQGPQVIEIECADSAIPPSTGTVRCTVSVGPDVVIVTDSTVSWTGIYNYYSYSTRFEPNDNNQRIRKFQALSAGATMSPLDDTDLTAGTTVPPAAAIGAAVSNKLGTLLSGISGGDNDLDLLRCTINPTGYWDDLHGLNVNGARPFQHSDPNSSYGYYGQTGPYYYTHANWQPSCTSVDLPDVEGVTQDKSVGRFTDGGRCYHFESDNRFGVFIIRSDASIYVPFAMRKAGSPGAGGFGDGIFETKSDSQQNSLLRTVQMTVSPNGRIAAMKLKQTPTNQLENAASSRIVLFSLTGEKLWGGETYTIIDPGGAATGSASGRYLLANSMALTDTHLYFLFGTQTSQYYQSWSSHYIMRYQVLGGGGSASLLTGNGAWTQAPNTPMQTTFQHWYLSPYRESSTSYGNWGYHRYWREEGANFIENGLAPLPFRVSRNGKACAILAGSNATTTLSTLVYSNYLWVDYEGSGARQATSTRRHATAGGGRGYSLACGPQEYAMWGRFTGPTTGLEISDDGLRAAFTYTDYTGSFYASQSGTSSSHTLLRNRQNVVCCSTTASDQWATIGTTVEKEVTKSAFAGSHRWRFGALVFTADNDGLLFWGGAPAQNATTTSYTYMQSLHFNGTMYACSNLNSTSSSVTSTLLSSEGGSPDGVKTYTTTAFNPSSTSGLNNRYGTLQPIGGFISKNRNFLYICDLSGITTTYNTACMLVGFNISTLSSGTINGHKNGEGFVPKDWPSRRGFMGNYVYYPGYVLYYSNGYAPTGHGGGSRQVMARDTGTVFWPACYQYNGPGTTTSSTYGGPVIPTYGYGAYGYGGTGVYGFNADMGGAVAELQDPSWIQAGTNLRERYHYLEPSDDGTKLAYVTCTHYLYSQYNAERVQLVTNISFDTSNGAIHGGFDSTNDAQKLEASNGRSGESMAIIPNGTDMFYAYKAGASNETTLEMVKVKVDASGSTTKTKYSGVTGRINVLFAGRGDR